jgi:hypothetical protein
VAISEALGDCFGALAMTGPSAAPENHTGKDDIKALTKAIRSAAAPQQGNNNCFLARSSVFLDRRALNG